MPPLAGLVTALGIAQIISWGSLFYAIGVLGPAMRADMGIGELFLFGAFTGALLVSGTLAPMAGRLIDRRGGRVVLSFGSVVAGLAMVVLAVSPHPAVMVAGWLVAGVAMAACLYDPAFATLSQHAGLRYRRAVTALTLFGGFASTVFWPLSHVLMEAWGWRVTCAIYAAMHLGICLPIHLLLVPRPVRSVHQPPSSEEGARAPGTDEVKSPSLAGERRGEAQSISAFKDRRLKWLTLSLAISTFVFGVVAVHLVNLLTAAGLTAGEAVTISMLVGPMQVVGRIIEFGFSGRVKAVTVGMVAFGLMLTALLSLMSVDGMGVAAVIFVIAYGCGNGVITIVRGTSPVELFGSANLGSVLGYIARASLYAKAMAPASFSALLTFGFTRNAALAALVGVALVGMASFAVASRKNNGVRA